MPLVVTPSGTYFRPENADTLLLGHAHATPPEPDFSHADQDTVPPALHHAGDADGLAVQAWMDAADAVPALGGFAGLHATTAGFYATTPDHAPFLDRDPQVDNLLRLVGFSGHGAMFGPFTAAVAVALAQSVGGPRPATITLPTGDVDLAAFRIGRAFHAPEGLVI
jgi:glycine/D-amino acid oxidase-like deaminating enzyme